MNYSFVLLYFAVYFVFEFILSALDLSFFMKLYYLMVINYFSCYFDYFDFINNYFANDFILQ